MACIRLSFADCDAANLSRPISSIGQSVVINSPGYPPGPYPNNQNCTWYVRGPITSVLRVESIFFDVEGYTDDCIFDFMQFFEIGTPPIPPSRKYCAPWKIITYTTSVFSMLINFQTDNQIVRYGFSLNITAIEKPSTTTKTTTQIPTTAPNLCNQNFTANSPNFSINFYTPNFPYNYPNKIFCPLTIENALFNQNQSIEVIFISFQTQLTFDYLLIVADSVVETFSGTVASGYTRVYNARQVELSFFSDSSKNFQGFDLLVQLIPQPCRFINFS